MAVEKTTFDQCYEVASRILPNEWLKESTANAIQEKVREIMNWANLSEGTSLSKQAKNSFSELVTRVLSASEEKLTYFLQTTFEKSSVTGNTTPLIRVDEGWGGHL